MITSFFSKHPVFTLEELRQFLEGKSSGNPAARNALLAYHRKRGRILPVRRGLYMVVPSGSTPETCPVDPYLLAGKMTNDAVLAYHTALEFFGKAYSAFERFFYLTERKSLPVKFRAYEFQCVLLPKRLQVKSQANFGVIRLERSGVEIRVTSLERTLVDVLDRLDLGGSWEEIWRSLESIEFFDLDQVVEYARLLGNATTIAKTGFFLEQHGESLMVDNAHLRPLRELRPSKPHYMAPGAKRRARLVAEWNLMVPVEILENSWAEVS